MPNANIGEWSEVYALIKVLSEKGVAGADKNLRKLDSVFYHINSIRRVEQNKTKIIFADIGNEVVSEIENALGVTTVLTVPRSELKPLCDELLFEMQTNKGVFDVSSIRDFLKEIGIESLKSPSKKKGDIELEINDKVTNQLNNAEFSLKSYLGGLPTLLNAGQTTKFRFELLGFSGDWRQINADEKPAKGKVQRKADAVFKQSEKISFVELGPDAKEEGVFLRNLQILDFEMPKILAAMLFLFQKGEGRTIAELAPRLIEFKSEFDLHPRLDSDMLEIKLKNLLMNSALGMVPGTKWDGRISVGGGYIVVRQDGELVCFHVYNYSDLADYLFTNICFETASTSRYNFGKIFKESGSYFFDLVLQLRFIRPKP